MGSLLIFGMVVCVALAVISFVIFEKLVVYQNESVILWLLAWAVGVVSFLACLTGLILSALLMCLGLDGIHILLG